MFLNSIIFGGIEDQVGVYITSFVKSSCTNLLGAPFGYCFGSPWRSNEPIFTILYRGGAGIFNAVLFTNVFSLMGIVLAFWFSYSLFKKLGLVKALAVSLALIFSLSPYILLHFGIHPQLMQIWFIPLFIERIILEKGLSFFNVAVTGFVLSVAVLTSNYLGFFLILFTVCFLVSKYFVLLLFREFSSEEFLAQIKGISVMFLIFFSITLPILLPYIKANYGGKDIASAKSANALSANRTLEDFQNFSSRPWYYILPPLANPVLGKAITMPVLNWMKNGWGYFLADDYFPKEHGGNYLGWFNLGVFFVVVYLAIKDTILKLKSQISNVKTKSKSLKSFYSIESLKLILVLAITVFLLFLFTFPPFFTVGGHKIYTLGFVLYKFFPMFRVTARLGIVILMCVLVVNGLFINRLYEISQESPPKAGQHRAEKIKFHIFFGVYLLLTLFEFYVPISTFDTSKVPDVYEYLSKVDRKVSLDFIGPNGKRGRYDGPPIIAEYPGGRSEDVFWITKHHKGLINPRAVFDAEYNFSSESFTKKLNTKEGLENAQDLGVSYIVFHKDRGCKLEDIAFFRGNMQLEKEFANDILFSF